MSIFVGTQIVPTPGNLPALLATEGRYQNLVKKLGGTVIGGFQIAIGQGQGSLGTFVSWPDLAAYEKAMQQTQTDADWQKFVADTGSMIAALNSTIYTPTPGSPLK